MSNLFDYLTWRGDLTVDAAPLNEVDFAIMSSLAYIRLEKVAASNLTGMSLSELYERFGDTPKVNEILDFDRSVNLFWIAMSQSVRFGGARMRRFVSVTEDNEVDEKDKQFAAATLTLDTRDGEVAVITFRGTDSTMVGWRENFTMGYEDTVPAQRDAKEYAEDALERFERVYLCGHSKGGNLALFAAATVKPELRDRILGVYNYDGPGLNDKLLATEGWAAVRDRVRTFVPPSSVVGMLFGNGEPRQVVQADGSGILQHDVFMWHVLGPSFVAGEEMTASSEIFDRGIDEYLADTGEEERKTFVYALFKLVDAAGITTTEDMVPVLMKSLPGVLRAGLINKDEALYSDEEIAALKRFFGYLKRSGGEQLSESLADIPWPWRS